MGLVEQLTVISAFALIGVINVGLETRGNAETVILAAALNPVSSFLGFCEKAN